MFSPPREGVENETDDLFLISLLPLFDFLKMSGLIKLKINFKNPLWYTYTIENHVVVKFMYRV